MRRPIPDEDVSATARERKLPSVPYGDPVVGARHLIGLLTPAIRKAESAGASDALLYLLEARATAQRIVASADPERD